MVQIDGLIDRLIDRPIDSSAVCAIDARQRDHGCCILHLYDIYDIVTEFDAFSVGIIEYLVIESSYRYVQTWSEISYKFDQLSPANGLAIVLGSL